MEPKPTYKTVANAERAELGPEDIENRWWLSFTADHDPTDAGCRFTARVGTPPEYVVIVLRQTEQDVANKRPAHKTMLLVGPLRMRPTTEQPQHVYLADALAPTVTQGTLF